MFHSIVHRPVAREPYKKRTYKLGIALAFGVALFEMPPFAEPAHAAAIQVLSDFAFLQNEGFNDAGFGSDPGITFGVMATPNPGPNNNNGPTGNTTVTATQNGVTRTVPYFFSSANPNEFVTTIPNTSLRGTWAYTLTNPSASNSPFSYQGTVSIPNGTVLAPTTTNMLLTPNGTTPTLSWTTPGEPGFTLSAQTIFIYDKSTPTPNHEAQLIYTSPAGSVSLPNAAGQTTWKVPLAASLNPTDDYTISIQVDQNTGSTLNSRSRTFVNFNVGSFGTSTTPVYVPVLTVNNQAQFDIAVTGGKTYAIDPPISSGFIYAIGNGDPNFATVLLPDLQGTEPYTITWDNGLDTEQVLGGELLNFLTTDPLGVSTFTVAGIDPADNVDPSSGTEFVTDVTFVGSGTFTGTMTPITAPEPPSLAMLGMALVGLCLICGRNRKLSGHS